jgi:DNA gyrase subunit A
MSDAIEKREITRELQESYLDYAMSVIVQRALPDVRDGLKPVHRRVLWTMWETGSNAGAKFTKSANAVGTTMARYHPHGDASIYDTLVRMAQDFSLRYPLIHGQGNFGSVDGDSAAAMRYTESKLARISDELLGDIEKETVDWQPNYDASREEPRVLPARLPNLLLNGAEGIAVGMATRIPPHNLTELADGILHLAENPGCTVADLMQFVTGPDYPTGGTIFDSKAIEEAYTTGRGSVTCRAEVEIEEKQKGYRLLITELPFQVNKSELIKKFAELVTDKRIEGIRDIRDESDREGMRIVIELKNDASPQKVLNQLYKFTDLQKDFHFNMIALVGGGLQPQLLSLKDILAAYLEHRREVVRRRTQYELKKAQEREHILEGLSIALNDIENVIKVIRGSANKDEAHGLLKTHFGLTDNQATAIHEMRLQTLAALERGRIEDELAEKKKLIASLQAILASEKKITKIVTDEVTELRDQYGDKRRTKVVSRGLTAMSDEDLVAEEEVVITLSAGGYIKRLPPDTFKSQKRGGKGLIGSNLNDEDAITQVLSCNTHDWLLFFTDKGRVLQTRAYEIPEASRTAKGRAIHNFLELPTSETVTSVVNYPSATKKGGGGFLILATRQGVVKRTPLEDFRAIRKTGIIALSLRPGDTLLGAKLSTGKDEVMLTTKKGQSIRFAETDARAMGRAASGVAGIKLGSGDRVAGFDVIAGGEKADTRMLLVVMENGYAKQTPLKEYKQQKRSGSGIRTAVITEKTGAIVASRVLGDEEEIIALSKKGLVIRTDLASVRTTGRAAQGVKLMTLKANDGVAGVALV